MRVVPIWSRCGAYLVNVVDELRVVGSRCGPMQPALELLAAGLDPSPLITATFPLAQAGPSLSPSPSLSLSLSLTLTLSLTLSLALISRPPSRQRRWARPSP